MKILKIEHHYYLMEEATITESDYMWNGVIMYKVIKNTSMPQRGWKVLGTSDLYLEDLPIIQIDQIEKPMPTVFTSDDMIKYSNWMLTWCSTNKYRKTTEGVQPFGTGDSITDGNLFKIYLESLVPNVTEWNNVEAIIDGKEVLITKL